MTADGTGAGPDDDSDAAEAEPDGPPSGAPGTEDLTVGEELRRLREELEAIEEEVEDRTVHRTAIEAELKRYVRRRLRRGHARGWGPYLVLLYGTAMTLGAFRFLDGAWAILAMIVVWLSTLGLYVVMVLVGLGINALGVPRWALDTFRKRRS